MISSKHPAFARPGLTGPVKNSIDGYLHSIEDSNCPVNECARGSALAPCVHNICNRIEDVMRNLANDIDGHVPTAESAHQDLPNQTSAAIAFPSD